MINVPNDKSVIIFTNPRTGSYAVSETVHKQLDDRYTLFQGPSYDKKNLNKFFIFHEAKKPYILKEHSLHFHQWYPDNFITDQHFIIRLRRKNVLDQIVSNYIARYRKGWVRFTDEHLAENIPMDEQSLLKDFDWINTYNKETEKLPYKVDLEMYFEDMNFPDDLSIRPSPKPLNHTELKLWAAEVLENKV